MHLLGNMLFHGQHWDVRRFNAGEGEQGRRGQHCWGEQFRIAKADVQRDGVETPASELSINMKAHRTVNVICIIEPIRPSNYEDEVVLCVERLGCTKIVGGTLLRVLATEVDVLCRASAISQPVIKCQTSFQDPPSRSNGDEPSKESVKDDHLSEAVEGNVVRP
jgi:hypothetical protein